MLTRRRIRTACSLAAVCGLLTCCTKESSMNQSGAWLDDPRCADLRRQWRSELGALDGHVPILDLRLSRGQLSVDPKSSISGQDWLGTLELARNLNPKPIIVVHMSANASCWDSLEPLNRVSKAYACDTMKCVVAIQH